jgi:two-component system phosphate regulon sensor histidine kinase PhoR
MRSTFRTKLLASYAGLVASVLVVVDLALNRTLSEDLSKELDTSLELHAKDAADMLDEGTPADWVSRHIAKASNARTTIIASDGKVLADSDVSEEALAQLENHGSRPEVLAAKGGAIGRSTRFSATLKESMRYVAVEAKDRTIVRVAFPLTRIESTIGAMRVRLVGASFFAFIIAVALSAWIARATAQPLRMMTSAAERLARGDFDLVMPGAPDDDFGALSRAFSSLAAQLRDHIGDLTEERDRLAAMAAGMVEGVLVVSSEGRVVIANRSAEKILEAEGPLKDRTIAEAIRHPKAREALERAIHEGLPVEASLEPFGLSARSVALNIQPLAVSEGGGGGAVAVLHDVTALRKLETIRRDFVSNVSHELQTPVASIQSYTETLLDGALSDPDASRRFVDTIHRNATRMGRLVKDLLKLAELETRSPDKIVREAVDVKDVVDHVIATIRLRTEASAAEIAVDVPDDVRALGDPDGVAQMLLNLLENALKYGRQGGKVSVSVKRDDGFIRIAVEDDGSGIELRHHSRIFERFYRVDEGRSRERGGTGLGLAIVKHLAESMNGSVRVDSELGRGSKFTVRIPAARS